ncbi:beta-ketoacyl synthase N-terminal-like domain-containing protein, partial [Streptomyces sp. NPDC002537]
MGFEPIAIVGRGCVLPGALTPDRFWDDVAAGRSALGPAPPGRWRLPPAVAVTATTPDGHDHLPGDTGGYVHGFADAFDPAGFALDSADVLSLDPLVQWVLHAGRQALREAGHSGPAPHRTGLVLGNLCHPSDAATRHAEHVWAGRQEPTVRDALLAAGRPPDPHDRFCSGLPALLAARALGLDAGAFALDAACASALYAVKLACDRLHDRSAGLMLAGAVNGADSLLVHSGFAAVSALSPTGRSRPFHRDADGLVPAEGTALVALMRLADALAQDRPVLAVIRGIGLGNDGRGSGFLSPDPAGQEHAMRLAYTTAGIAPETVGLLECHATGTAVGDAAEIASTGRLFAAHRGLPIGSVKSNVGHLLAPAGAAGLLKAVGALTSGLRPATLGADIPSPALRGHPLRLLTQPEDWSGPRRAAVSAFGFGGTNAHVVLDAWDERTAPAPPPATCRPVEQPADEERPDEPVAVVALAVRTGDDGDTTAGFVHAVLNGRPARAPRTTVSVALDGLCFPPADLEETLPQQILALDAAREAAAGLVLPRERTAVLVGMGNDPRAARFPQRRRIAHLWERAGLPAPPGTVDRLRDACHALVGAASAVGSLPNIVANRINAQLDLAGPGFTVSCEEASGVVALWLAARALRTREADAVLVGAVDLSHDEVHTAALDGLGLSRAPGDAAVVLVLKRLADAERDGDPVLALLDDPPGAEADLRIGANLQEEGRCDVTELFGSAHAACGLLAVATAVTALHHRVRPRPAAPAEPLPGARTAEVVVPVLDGPAHRVGLRAAAAARSGESPRDSGPDGPRVRVPAHAPDIRFPLPDPPPGVMRATPAVAETGGLEATVAEASGAAAAAVLRHGARVRALHRTHLAACTDAHLRFLRGRGQLAAALATARPRTLGLSARPRPARPGPGGGRGGAPAGRGRARGPRVGGPGAAGV